MAANRTSNTATTQHHDPVATSARLIYVGDLRDPGRSQLARQALDKLRRTDPRRVRLLEIAAPGIGRDDGLAVQHINMATALATVRQHAGTGTLHLPMRHPLLGEVALHALASGCAPESINSAPAVAGNMHGDLCMPGHGFIECLPVADFGRWHAPARAMPRRGRAGYARQPNAA
ncbi:MAG: hypothetical protein NVV60_09790 [Luteimonas sp.]|nr:hypothetical protein [Luteimonas sp.]